MQIDESDQTEQMLWTDLTHMPYCWFSYCVAHIDTACLVLNVHKLKQALLRNTAKVKDITKTSFLQMIITNDPECDSPKLTDWSFVKFLYDKEVLLKTH